MIYAFTTGKIKYTSILFNSKYFYAGYVLFGNNLDHYLQIIVHEQPKYLIGIGTYSGIDQEKIRIETRCTNQFRNRYIDTDYLREHDFPAFLTQDAFFKRTTRMGNGRCNYFSYRITSFLKKNHLATQFTFLHIPRSFSAKYAGGLIDAKLRRLS